MKTDSNKELTKKLTMSKSILIFILILLSSSSQVTAQAPFSYSNAGAKYNVSIGETAQFKYTIINYNGKNYFNDTIYYPNRTFLHFRVLIGTIITLNIKNITSSTINQPRIELQFKYTLPNGSTYADPNISYYIAYGLFIPAYENKSSIDKEVNYTNTKSSWSKDDDNLFYYGTNSTIYQQNLPIYEISTERIFNWHTGWLQSSEYNMTYENGTIYQQSKIELVTNDQLLNIIIAGTIVGGIVLVVGIMVVYSKHKKNRPFKIVKEPTIESTPKKLSRKERKMNENTVNKSLTTIDEILQETNQTEK